MGRALGRAQLAVGAAAGGLLRARPPARQWLLSAAPLADYPPRPLPPAPLAPEATLATAVAALRQALDDFFDYHARHPEATHAHPAFGPLTYGQWLVMHFKHFNHHFMQFGLLPDSLLPHRRPHLLLPDLPANLTSTSA